MKIIVIANIPLDSNHAHAINTSKIADGFVKLGHKVTIICRNPINKGFSRSNFIKKFALSESIEIKCFRFFKIFYLIDRYIFALQIVKDLYFLKPNLVYARDYISPYLSSLLKIKYFCRVSCLPRI